MPKWANSLITEHGACKRITKDPIPGEAAWGGPVYEVLQVTEIVVDLQENKLPGMWQLLRQMQESWVTSSRQQGRLLRQHGYLQLAFAVGCRSAAKLDSSIAGRQNNILDSPSARCISQNQGHRSSVGVYVDDLLLLSEQAEQSALSEATRGVCGVQKKQVGSHLFIHQMQYVGDLNQRYTHAAIPAQLPESCQEPSEDIPTPETVQHAQKLIGEVHGSLVELGRTSHTPAQPCGCPPGYATESGEQILEYLFSLEAKLGYGPCVEAAAASENALPAERAMACTQ